MDDISSVAKVFKALGNDLRLQIFIFLLRQPLCNCELVELLDVSQSAISQHLSRLLDEGLVESLRVGQWTFYRSKPQVLTETVEQLKNKDETDQPLLKKIDEVLEKDLCSIRTEEGSPPANF